MPSANGDQAPVGQACAEPGVGHEKGGESCPREAAAAAGGGGLGSEPMGISRGGMKGIQDAREALRGR